LIALYSASFNNVRVSQQVFYDQLIFAAVGLTIMLILSRINYHWTHASAYFLYIVNVIVLIMVLVSGRHALGATRWFELGVISFQPSEFMKLALIFVLARYFAACLSSYTFNYATSAQRLNRNLLIPLFIALMPIGLIFKQPDLGTAILLFGIFLTMLFIFGIERRFLFTFLFFCLSAVPFGWHFLKQYQKDRILVFLNPNIDPLGSGYTIIQSKIAVGSGQIFGKGWLAGTQNQLNFLPERHTDFIFSVVGEEWGLFGSLLLVFFFFQLIRAMFDLAEEVTDQFAHYVTIGVTAIFTMQVIINIGMVMGMLPIVGITLPLVSYGRSSFFISVVMLGLLLNFAKRNSV
jgi:rod shape determining protein RodA